MFVASIDGVPETCAAEEKYRAVMALIITLEEEYDLKDYEITENASDWGWAKLWAKDYNGEEQNVLIRVSNED